MTAIHDSLTETTAHSFARPLRAVLRVAAAAVRGVRRHVEFARAEAELMRMPANQLHDIGLTRMDIRAAVRGLHATDQSRRTR